MIRETTAIGLPINACEPRQRFTKAYRSVGLRASSTLTNNASTTTTSRDGDALFAGQGQSSPVNDPCRSHAHCATPRVVRQPYETVLDRELQGPRPSAAALFVYVSGSRGPLGTEPFPRGNPRRLAAQGKPGHVLRFATFAKTASLKAASGRAWRAKLSTLGRERSSGFTGGLSIAPNARAGSQPSRVSARLARWRGCDRARRRGLAHHGVRSCSTNFASEPPDPFAHDPAHAVFAHDGATI